MLFRVLKRIIQRFFAQTNRVTAKIAPFVKHRQKHQTFPKTFIDFGIFITVKTKKFSLQIALSLNHQHTDGEKIVFTRAFERIGKIE